MRKPAEFETHPCSFSAAQAAGLARACCHHVTDGDTYDFLIDLGFMSYAYDTIRLYGANAPEIFHYRDAAEKAAGEASKSFAASLLLPSAPVLLRSFKDRETFGRFVAYVYVLWDADLSENFTVEVGGVRWVRLDLLLIEKGLAVQDT